ncbi:MAG TPA: protein kinase [Kofleriaceae bacterium]|nr:protein kinase [Kofleriaceae bacterium]
MLKHLASGGMADVVLGRSDGIEGFERHVVLKRIRPELARDQRFIRMFLDEARVAATLHHQHIVQVHDIGEAAGEYFIAMEYVHGEDVRKILSSASKQRTHVPLGHAVAIVSAAAAGLHYAHERRGTDMNPLNIVHRDVSPSNILVGYDGSIKVVDFGIATASMRQETRSGSLKGKLSYMSPEQCKGAVVDRRSDVYSLGVVLYELATTSRMIKGENDYLVMEQIVHGKISSPQLRRPSLPNELTEIIMRALATERDRRYATADDLRVALDQFASSAGLTASSSAMASYLRQQFGQRPEPWLERGGTVTGMDEVPTSIEESLPSNSWTELPRSDAERRRSTSSIPRQSGPLGVIGDAPPDLSTRSVGPMRTPVAPIPLAPPPTDSRMGWESQRPPAGRFPTKKVALIGGGLAGAAAIWLVVSIVTSRVTPAPAPTIAQPAPVVTAPAPAVAQPPPPPPVPESAPTPTPAPQTEVAVREPEPSPSRKTRPAAAATPRAAARAPIETPPPPKPERATRVAVVTSPPPAARTDAGVTEIEPRPALTPPPPPVPQNVPPPAPPDAGVAPSAPVAVAPQIIPPNALDANRIAGEKSIAPDETTMDAIGRSGTEKLISSYKVCVTAEGAISAVSQLRSTGFPAYDAKIQTTIRRDWRFRPFIVNGKATPVCTALRFIYSQK